MILSKEQIKQLRKAMGLSQKGLAERVGVKSGNTVARWERGAASPKGKTPSPACVLGKLWKLHMGGGERK